MKKDKLSILLIIGILLTSINYSQNQIKIGVNAGTTLASFRGNESVNNANSRIAFLIGISYEYFLTENLSIKSNLNYERKSITEKGSFVDIYGNPTNEINFYTNFDYLTLPILLKYGFGELGNFYVNGGPFLGFLLSTKTKANGFPTDNSTNLNKKIDIGLSLGFGTKFNLNNKNDLGIELRDNYGLINISDVPVYNNGEIKTNSLNLILSWNFEL